jgi:hypothetical protein
MGEAHRAFTSMDRVLQRTTTNSDNKVSKLIDQLKARTDEFTAATNKTMNAINPTGTLVERMRAYGTAVSVGVFIGAAVTAGVLAGLASLKAMRAPQLKEAREEAKRIFKKFTAGGPAPPTEDTHLEERVGAMERKLGETRVTLQERVTAVEAMETTGRQALEARVLELEMRVPNLVALQERIDNVELSIARLAAIEEQVASGAKLSSRRMS